MLTRVMLVLVCMLFCSHAFGIPPTDQVRNKLKNEDKWNDLLELRQAAIARGLDQPSHPIINFSTRIAESPEAVEFRVLYILVDFLDRVDTAGYAQGTASQFNTLLFSDGGDPTASMRDYWSEVSYGELDVTGDVVGCIRMPHLYSFYANGAYGVGAYPNNLQKLAEDAIIAADSIGVDFSQYDNDDDGDVDGVMIIFAGRSADETGNPGDLWSISWQTVTPLFFDGKSISDFTTQPEETLYGGPGLSTIGRFCYNLGKTMGLRSLDDWNGDANGLGNWSLMAGGFWLDYGRSPAHLDAYSRAMLGLVTLTVIGSNVSLVLPPVENSAVAYALWTDGSIGSEYFVVENRQQVGFDYYLPGGGVLIYHIDESTPEMNFQWIESPSTYGDPHYHIALEQADGSYDLELAVNNGDDGDPWTNSTGNFNYSSYPSSRAYSGAATNVAVSVGMQLGNSFLVDMYVTAVDPPVDTIPHTIITAGTGDFYYADAADLDRDGRMDLVYSDPSANGLLVAYGRLDIGLETPINYASIGPAAITLDFIDADTLLDIVGATSVSTYVLLNGEDRSFLTLSPVLTNAPSGSMANTLRAYSPHDGSVPSVVTGLFDGDDNLDIVVTPGHIYFGLGDGTFDGPEVLPFTFSNVNSCDFNYDGSDDLVTLSGNQVYVYLNDGFTPPTFTPAASVPVGTPSLEIPASSRVADLDFDGDCDFVIVAPLASPVGQSRLTAVLWDDETGLDHYLSISIDGIAYDVVTADANRDGYLDIVVANGTLGRLEFYFGDGNGNFSMPSVNVDLDAGVDIAYVLATLDLNLDGNPDYVSGSTGEGVTRLAYSDSDPAPVITNPSYMPMTTAVSADVSVTVVNPEGFVISRDFRTVSGSDYWRVDFNQDGFIEEQAVDYNVIPGEYKVTARLHPDAPPNSTISMGIGIDGSQMATLLCDYDPGGLSKNGSDSIVFYYEVYPPDEESDIWPLNGDDVEGPSPTFAWDGLVSGPGDVFSFALCSTPTMAQQKTDSALGLTVSHYTLTESLEVGKLYYWQVGFDRDQDEIYDDFSRVFAVRIVKCCVGRVGDANNSGDDEPTIGDIGALIDALFLAGTCDGVLACMTESDANQSGGTDPICDDITISDISVLIAYLFINGPYDPVTNPEGVQLLECL